MLLLQLQLLLLPKVERHEEIRNASKIKHKNNMESNPTRMLKHFEPVVKTSCIGNRASQMIVNLTRNVFFKQAVIVDHSSEQAQAPFHLKRLQRILRTGSLLSSMWVLWILGLLQSHVVGHRTEWVRRG